MVSNYSDLKGKTVLITGCNRGIGRKMVEYFAAQGCGIIACVRTNTDEFSNFLNSLSEKYSINTEQILVDLADQESITVAMREIFKKKLSVDILINNAGIAHGGLLTMTPINTVKEVFEVNFFSQVLITQYVARWMQKRGKGAIINMASIAGIESIKGYTAYGSSKAAMIFFTKTISKELAPYGIRVNAIAPGLIDTDMAQQMESKAAETMVTQNSLSRLGTTSEIAELVLFLASDASSYINGQIIRIDGGL